MDLQTQYNLLSTEITECLLLKSQGYIYEHGDNAGRLLAHQLKCRSASEQIPQIRKDDGELTIHPEEIKKTFTTFYSNLYTSEMTNDCSDMQHFFNNLQAPSVKTVHRTETELRLNCREITTAIKAMQNGKTPGPDGYPIEFYKRFFDKLITILLDMFNDSLPRPVFLLGFTRITPCLVHPLICLRFCVPIAFKPPPPNSRLRRGRLPAHPRSPSFVGVD